MSYRIRPLEISTWDAFPIRDRYGFTRGQQVGKHGWIMSRTLDVASN
jgi:hypothetical protein